MSLKLSSYVVVKFVPVIVLIFVHGDFINWHNVFVSVVKSQTRPKQIFLMMHVCISQWYYHGNFYLILFLFGVILPVKITKYCTIIYTNLGSSRFDYKVPDGCSFVSRNKKLCYRSLNIRRTGELGHQTVASMETCSSQITDLYGRAYKYKSKKTVKSEKL